MASLKEIRIRIASVESTQKITSAMKMVSAAKLRRAQNAIINLRPYSNKLNEILGNLSSAAESRVESVAHQKSGAGGKNIVPHQRLVVVQAKAFEEAHRDEDTG